MSFALPTKTDPFVPILRSWIDNHLNCEFLGGLRIVSVGRIVSPSYPIRTASMNRAAATWSDPSFMMSRFSGSK